MTRKLLLINFLLMAACSHLPETIENPPLYDISYEQAIQNPSNLKNSPIRWGGVIVDVENEQNASLVQILFYPLNGSGRPVIEGANPGRFVIKTAQFLDPAIYTKNTQITVAGTLNGVIERTIGKKNLQLPLVSASTIHLWPPQLDNSQFQGGYGYGFPPNGFGFYPYPFRPYYRPFMTYPWW